jgi:hypothetical protein
MERKMIKSSEIGEYSSMYLAPQEVFDTELYVEYNGALHQCKVLYIENYVCDGNIAFKQEVVAEVANEDGEVTFKLFNAYKSVEDYKKGNIFYSSNSMCSSCKSYQSMYNIGGTKYRLDDIINNHIANRPFCHFTTYQGCSNSLKTYKWNGLKVVNADFDIENVIIQDKYEVCFESYYLNAHIDGCYYTQEECERDNTIKVVEFDKEEESVFNWDKVEEEYELQQTLKEMKVAYHKLGDEIRKLERKLKPQQDKCLGDVEALKELKRKLSL